MRDTTSTAMPTLHKRTSSLSTLSVAPLSISKPGYSLPGTPRSPRTPRSSHSPHSPLTPRTPRSTHEPGLPREPQTPGSINSWATSNNNDHDRSSFSIPSLGSPPSLAYSFELYQVNTRLLRRRHNAIRELYETEKQFAQDMAVVVRLYMCSSADIGLSPAQIGALFSNVTEILDVSLSLVAILETQVPETVLCGNGSTLGAQDVAADAETRVGHALCLFLTSPMYQAFETYTHTNREQMNVCFSLRLAARPVQRWLGRCGREARSFTTAWSLDALLIKPVQRLAKYPLFLGTLLDATDKSHPDYGDLETAHRRARHYIECINARFGCTPT